MNRKTLLFIAVVFTSAMFGAVEVLFAVFCGGLFYSTHLVPNEPHNAEANLEVFVDAVNCGSFIYLFGLALLSPGVYKSLGFRMTSVLFFIIPMTVYLFWRSIGETPSLFILSVVAAFGNYQALVDYTKERLAKRA